MTPLPFRFSPPEISDSAELRWVLARSFGPRELAVGRCDGPGAIELAGRLGLLPRLALRKDPQAIAADLGVEAAARLRDARAQAVARELWFEETESALAEISGSLGLEPALLKGRALTHAGDTLPGARPASDIDLLVPEAGLTRLRSALLAAGFEEVRDTTYEHHDPPLRRPGGAPVELHRHLPGVRIAGPGSATWGELDRAGLIGRGAGAGRLSALRLPARELLAAHALVHALAQHGLTTSYPGWLLIADLLDLGAAGSKTEQAALTPGWERWIARELSPAEIDAAVALAGRLAAGEVAFSGPPGDRPALLARHFVACALDPEYGRALKARWLETPMSDRPRPLARLRLVVRALAPPIDASPAASAEGAAQRAWRWITRPVVLLARSARAWAARRRVARRAAGASARR